VFANAWNITLGRRYSDSGHYPALRLSRHLNCRAASPVQSGHSRRLGVKRSSRRRRRSRGDLAGVACRAHVGKGSPPASRALGHQVARFALLSFKRENAPIGASFRAYENKCASDAGAHTNALAIADAPNAQNWRLGRTMNRLTVHRPGRGDDRCEEAAP
jgi:hypothetical protein